MYSNTDFYSRIVQLALGIPVSLFIGIFSMAVSSAGSRFFHVPAIDKH
jgi:hypothetical protein